MAYKTRTKIIATIGPTSKSKDVLKLLAEAGMTTARLNFSHGDHFQHLQTMETVRQVSDNLKIPISIMLDTKGPEIRIGKVKDGQQKIKKHSLIKIYFTQNKYLHYETGDTELTLSADVSKNITKGNNILVDDGKLLLNVLEKHKDYILAKAFNNHIISTNKRVNIPGVDFELPFLSEKDCKDIIFGAQQKVNYIAASFCNTAADVEKIREILKDYDSTQTQIIAKIESQIGINNIDAIIDAADGIMFARGDLALEIPYYDLPYWEKIIIRKCREKDKLIIIATQMLESMTSTPTPTRAEVTDVYYATELGADSTMLSGETANGQFPIISVKTMSRINTRAEKEFYSELYYEQQLKIAEDNCIPGKRSEIATNLALRAKTGKYDFAIVLSNTGTLLKRISQFRPNVTILSVTDDPLMYKSYGAWHSVFCTLVDNLEEYKKDNIKLLNEFVKKQGAEKGSKILYAHNYALIDFIVT